jgi:uncharacterized protein YqeY
MESTSIRARLEADLKQAMRERDVATREALRFAIAGLKNAEIANRGPLTEAQELEQLKRQSKRLEESIEQFTAAGRTDLVEKERGQLTVLQRYMPTELTDEELATLVAAAVAETGASDPKDMGKVMPRAIAAAGGRVSGKRLSDAVKRALSGTT